ncbi:hypothetical protein DIPPA_10943 [Diplonema papillatum]|nr:hypothetical protein DIPPA_10943 [Diplonema papillatum]
MPGSARASRGSRSLRDRRPPAVAMHHTVVPMCNAASPSAAISRARLATTPAACSGNAAATHGGVTCRTTASAFHSTRTGTTPRSS